MGDIKTRKARIDLDPFHAGSIHFTLFGVSQACVASKEATMATTAPGTATAPAG